MSCVRCQERPAVDATPWCDPCNRTRDAIDDGITLVVFVVMGVGVAAGIVAGLLLGFRALLGLAG